MNGPPSPGRRTIPEVVRYWERGRLGYNLALTGVLLAWVGLTWPHFRPALAKRSTPPLLALAALANLSYCAAYPLDFLLQNSPIREAWRRNRQILWLAGTLLAAVLACYWIADGIYPDFD